MTATATTTVLGLSAAIIWGAADSRRPWRTLLRVYWLLAISHASSLVALVLLADLLHQPLPDARILTYGLISGLAGGIALLVFYYALSLGSMGTTAAVTGRDGGASSVIFIGDDRGTQPSPDCRILPGCRSHLADRQSVEFQPPGRRGPAKKAGSRGDFRDWFWHFLDRAARSQWRGVAVAAGGVACR